MKPLYTFEQSLLGSALLALIITGLQSILMAVLFFIVFVVLSELIRLLGRAEWGWGIIGVVLVDVAVMVFVRGPDPRVIVMVAYLPLKLLFLVEGLQSALNISIQVARVIAYSAYAALLTSLITYFTLVIKHGLRDKNAIRKYVRRAALIIIVAVFGLASYACEHVNINMF